MAPKKQKKGRSTKNEDEETYTGPPPKAKANGSVEANTITAATTKPVLDSGNATNESVSRCEEATKVCEQGAESAAEGASIVDFSKIDILAENLNGRIRGGFGDLRIEGGKSNHHVALKEVFDLNRNIVELKAAVEKQSTQHDPATEDAKQAKNVVKINNSLISTIKQIVQDEMKDKLRDLSTQNERLHDQLAKSVAQIQRLEYDCTEHERKIKGLQSELKKSRNLPSAAAPTPISKPAPAPPKAVPTFKEKPLPKPEVGPFASEDPRTSDLERLLCDLNAKVDKLQQAKSSVKGDTAVKADIKELKASVAKQDEWLDGYYDEYCETKDKLETLSERVESKANQLWDLTDEVRSLDTEVGQEVKKRKELGKRLRDLEREY